MSVVSSAVPIGCRYGVPVSDAPASSRAAISRSPRDRGGQDMWKRDEAVKPASPQQQPAAPATPVAPTQSAASQLEPRRIERDVVNIGKSVVIKGELNGSEDLTIEGHVEGKIELKDNVLTIVPNGKINEPVFVTAVNVL